MPVIDAIDEKKYGRLPAKYLPTVIRSDNEHDRVAELLMKLSLSEERAEEEERLIRATGITTYLKNGGKVEVAQQIAGHESARTTGLYDRRDDEVSLDEVERIVI